MDKRKLVILPMMVLCLASFAGAWHPHLLFGRRKKAAVTDTVAKKTEYEKLFNKQHKVVRGFITLHQINGKVYFELPVTLLGKDMLIGSTVTNVSDNGNAIVGSKPNEPLLVKFTRNKTHVQLREVNTDYVTSETAIDSALVKSHTDAVLSNTKIAAWNKDSSAVVFDMTPFFVSDNKKMSPFDDNSVYSSSYNRSESYKSENSYLVDVKAFSDNVSVKSSLSYTFHLRRVVARNSSPTVLSRQSLPVASCFLRKSLIVPVWPIIVWDSLPQLRNRCCHRQPRRNLCSIPIAGIFSPRTRLPISVARWWM